MISLIKLSSPFLLTLSALSPNRFPQNKYLFKGLIDKTTPQWTKKRLVQLRSVNKAIIDGYLSSEGNKIQLQQSYTKQSQTLMLFQLHKCSGQRKSKSLQSDHQLHLNPNQPKNTSLYQHQLIKVKRRYNNKQQQPSQLSHYSPQNQCYPIKQPATHDRKPFFELHQIDINVVEGGDKMKMEGKEVHPHYQYSLKIPIQLVYEVEEQEENGATPPDQQMDNATFDRLLESNYQQEEELELEIQSKFAFQRSQKQAKEIALFEPDSPPQLHNTHQKLLEEQNHYLREELMHFTECIESERSKHDELKRKFRGLRKQNIRLSEEIQELNAGKKQLQAEISQKEILIMKMGEKIECHMKTIGELSVKNEDLESRVYILERQNSLLEERLQDYTSKKDKEMDTIQEEKMKLKETYLEYLCERQKQIACLQFYIDQLKSQIAQNQLEKRQKQSTHEILKQDEQEVERSNTEGTNSICLSLAEAQSLKNIIEEAQQAHQAEIKMLKQSHYDAEYSLKSELSRLEEKISKIEKENASLLVEEGKSRELTQNINKLISKFSSEDDPINIDDIKSQELQIMNYDRRLKNLQKHLLDQRAAKMNLVGKIKQLEQRCLFAEDEDDILLQNCVQQLQKQRQFNRILQNQNTCLKKMMRKQKAFLSKKND